MVKMDDHFKDEQPRKSIQSLPQSIPSLIGLKRNLTPGWIESICCIIKELPSKKTVGDSIVTNQILDKLESPSYDDEVDGAVSKIQGELASLNILLSQLALQRRQALNDYLDLKGNIRVFCRIRPFLPDATQSYERTAITSDSSNVFLRLTKTKSKQYRFDKVFQPHSTQEEVFEEIEPVIKSSLDGYNVCIFAYGQTGTGKTYTMEGRPENPGVVPRGLQALFEQAAESNYKYLFMFSMLEIYMGNLRDLLALRSRKAKAQKAPRLRIQTNLEGDVEIENLVTVKVSDFEQVKRFYELGTRFRSTASTMANSTSSRSHCLIRISLSCPGASERQREANKLWLVDLGGSERLLKTQASGRRLQEGKAINLSLSALGDVISALQSKKPHVPYRNSKLTQVLRDSLGSDSKTLMLVHVSPKECDMCETICSVGFAMRARSIHLESEEPADMRARKELLMVEREQKVTKLEGECQQVTKDIKKLDEKLKYLSSPQPIIYSCLSIEESQSSRSMNIQSSSSSIEDSASLPRFMRATICSQRKSGLNNHIYLSTRKKPPLHSKKRPSSFYAESVISPEKCVGWQSDYSSECSMPTTRYVNRRESEKDGTDYSPAGSEYEIKQVILAEQEKSPRNPMSSPESHVEDPENFQGNKTADRKSTDRWLQLQMTEKTGMYTRSSKRMLAIPIDKGNNSGNQENKGRNISQEIDQLCDRTRNARTVNKNSKSDFREEAHVHERVTSEAVIIEQSFNNAIVNEICNSFVASSSETTESNYHPKEDDRQAAEEDKTIPGYQQEYAESTKRVEISVESDTKQSRSLAFKENMSSMNSYREGFSNSQQPKDDAEKSFLRFRTLHMLNGLGKVEQRASFRDLAIPATRYQEKELKRGKFKLFLQSLQSLKIVWISALLGLGIHSLGLGDDFFQGLLF